MRILIRRLHYLAAQPQRVKSEALGYKILAAMARCGTPRYLFLCAMVQQSHCKSAIMARRGQTPALNLEIPAKSPLKKTLCGKADGLLELTCRTV